MTFENLPGVIIAIDWCEIEKTDVDMAMIYKLGTGYHHASIVYNRPLSCGNLKRLAEALSELNAGISEE